MLNLLARSITLAAVAAIAAGPAQATTMKLDAAGIQFELPDGWKSGPDGEDSAALRIENSDESIAFVISVAEADNIQSVAEAVGAEVDGYLKDVKVTTEGKEGEHGGMKLWSVSGTGTAEEDLWNWDITIFMAAKPVVVLSWASPETAKNPPPDMIAFLQSFKKI